MPNMRVISSNALDRANSFAASSEAITHENLRDQRRSKIWRATQKTASLTLQWSSLETIRCVCLPHTNFTASATMRVRGFVNVNDPSPLFDTGVLPCVRHVGSNPWGFEALPAGQNQYAYGGGSYAVLWFNGGAVRRLVIDISDTTNPSNIEAACMVVGDYWSPKFNATYGAGITFSDTTKNERAESGDLNSNRGTRFRQLQFNLALMPPADRDALSTILKQNGLHRPLLMSLYPEDDSPQIEWDHMIWAKLSRASAITVSQYNAYANTVDLEEI